MKRGRGSIVSYILNLKHLMEVSSQSGTTYVYRRVGEPQSLCGQWMGESLLFLGLESCQSLSL
jgi:hypothetical protein